MYEVLLLQPFRLCSSSPPSLSPFFQHALSFQSTPRRVGVAPPTFVVLPKSAVFSIGAVPPHSVPLHARADPPCLFFNLSILDLVSNL